MLAILSVGDPGSTFSEGLNVTKIYMTFILAFVGITNIIVSCLVGSLLWLFVEVAHLTAVHWLDHIHDLVWHCWIDGMKQDFKDLYIYIRCGKYRCYLSGSIYKLFHIRLMTAVSKASSS